MHVQKVMDPTGHTTHDFNPAERVSVEEAERRFKELTGRGFTAAKALDDGKHEVIREFDPTHKETLFFPRLIGG